MTSDIYLKYYKYEQDMQVSPTFSHLKHLQEINPSFITFTKLLSTNKRNILRRIGRFNLEVVFMEV